jgi:hypothetical protein
MIIILGMQGVLDSSMDLKYKFVCTE